MKHIVQLHPWALIPSILGNYQAYQIVNNHPVAISDNHAQSYLSFTIVPQASDYRITFYWTYSFIQTLQFKVIVNDGVPVLSASSSILNPWELQKVSMNFSGAVVDTPLVFKISTNQSMCFILGVLVEDTTS